MFNPFLSATARIGIQKAKLLAKAAKLRAKAKFLRTDDKEAYKAKLDEIKLRTADNIAGIKADDAKARKEALADALDAAGKEVNASAAGI